MIKIFNKLSTSITNQVYNFIGKQCLLCRTRVYSNIICCHCYDSIIKLNSICQSCGWPIAYNIVSNKCELCIYINKKVFTDIKIALPYNNPIDRLIQQFKYNYDLTKGRLLATLLLDYLNHNNFIQPEVIIPVPIHKKKLNGRGFNQTIEIAHYIGKHLNIPVDSNLIIKYKQTSDQMSQDKYSRQSNIEHSFCFNKVPKYNSVVILDDVVTTGSTVSEVADLLLTSKINKVSLWAIARRY